MGAKRCHVLSQPQQIDWITREIKPVVEAHLGDSLVLEYSRPMRGFTAADSTTTRYYDGIGSLTYNRSTTNPNPYAYAVVPDSYTQMDQLKLSGMINDDNRVYAFLMAGNTVNQEISMNRWFNDMDVRWTNTSLQNVSLTGYGTIYNEDEQMPNAAAVTAVNQGPTTDRGNQHLADQHRGGQRARPSSRLSQVHGRPERRVAARRLRLRLRRVAITGGYEYCDLDRQYAIYDLSVPAGGVLDESHTITNSFQVGPDYRWSACFDTYLHYKFQNADQPLLGVQPFNGLVNTPLPQHDHIVEIGFNWVPADWFVFNACVGIERGDTHGLFGDSATPINFDEENYPMSFSVWYAVSQKLSVSAGYAVYSNFVAQDISVADQSTYTTGSTSAAPPSTSRWNYGGQAQVVTLGSRYCLTECVRLTGDVEWVRGHDLITNSAITLASAGTSPVVPGGTIYDLGGYSEVLNETTRVRVGADWTVRPRVVVYGRYELYNFNDVVPGYQTGLAQGILGDLGAVLGELVP